MTGTKSVKVYDILLDVIFMSNQPFIFVRKTSKRNDTWGKHRHCANQNLEKFA